MPASAGAFGTEPMVAVMQHLMARAADKSVLFWQQRPGECYHLVDDTGRTGSGVISKDSA
jgi:hypothetical protein